MRVRLQRNGRSTGGRTLSRALGIPMLLNEGSRFRARPGDVIINWGSHDLRYPEGYYLNSPRAVAETRDKRVQWALMANAGVPTVEWTDDPQTARHWLVPEGPRVMTRSIVAGSQGRGIEVYSYEGTAHTMDYNRFIHAERTPIYAKVFGRNPSRVTEYRIHVVNGEVIDRQQKRRRTDYEGRINPYIRSAANGWVFCREGCEHHRELDQAAIESVESLGLDFGAVDCARGPEGSICIYEVNTAPGLEGRTVESYVRGFRNVRCSSS